MSDPVKDRAIALDRMLFDICETLQLTEAQHGKAEERYKAIARVLDGPNSPFSEIESNLYPQGSMRLGTTVKPIEGPHDLDFVCEFAVSHELVNPMTLLDEMYDLFKSHGVYGGMVDKKNRCVRITYKDEFYLDILPACRDHGNGGTCIQVPDRDQKSWSPSNPLGYAQWFENSTRRVRVTKFAAFDGRAMDKAASIQPVPDLQATEEKTVLQLIVQLLKRWRDIHYSDSTFPPISIVLTTLAADLYQGEVFLSHGLLAILERMVARLDAAHAMGHRLEVLNPSHREEDFSERWKDNLRAYHEFDSGIRMFAKAWRNVCLKSGNPNNDFEELFGEVVNNVLVRQARGLQVLRENDRLGIRASGVITSVASSISPMLRNTNHGAK
ncbi:MAG: hypothetical protein JWQ42_1490 [Edaphobacter sp.]|nr:hypothetical protein [Edaphobacter sp.]